jgi:uncharacterized membrane protein
MRYERARNAALLLGVGMGGFLDGIVLHQIAQWHQMLSAAVPPETMEAMKRNMAADGWFHMATWLVTLVGLFLLWSAVRGAGRLPSTRSLCGYMLVGWGAFNLAEGIVDHHLLELHHVRDLPLHVPLYDWIFLFVGGVGFILAGLAMLDGLGRPAPVGTERRSGFDRRSMVG